MRNARNKETVEEIRRGLVGLRRLFQRKELAALWARRFGDAAPIDYGELRLLDAIAMGAPATVGDVAERLGLDASRASRHVARAIARGLLVRRADAHDGRKVVLEVTRAGAALQRRGGDVTRARIADALAGWTVADRATLARLFGRFAADMASDLDGAAE
jgi:DNA-binding MarR family transcriptional regulator